MYQNNIFLFSKKIIFDMNKSKQSKIIKKIYAKKNSKIFKKHFLNTAKSKHSCSQQNSFHIRHEN